MQISKSDYPDPVTPGSPLQYTIVYTNAGNAPAQNMMITETYPANTTYNGIAVPQPTIGNNVWVFPLVNPGVTGSVQVILGVNSPLPVGTLLTNTVRVGGDRVASAVFTTTTPVTATPNVSIQKTHTPDAARPGDFLNYTITYQNDGSGTVSGTRITETYPSQVAFVSANPTPDNGTNNVWTIGQLLGNGGPARYL